MNEKLQKLKEKHLMEEYELHFGEAREARRNRALFALGGIKTADQLALSLAAVISSQALRALELFQQEKLYLDLGFETFVDFLQTSEFSPMTKNQYYDRKKLLDGEGDETYDLLNSLGLAVSTRKLLGKGYVRLEGENVIVLDSETGEETSIELKDRARLIETLTALADANADKSRKIEKQQGLIEKAIEKMTDLQAAFETERGAISAAASPPPAPSAPAIDLHSAALLGVIAACQALKSIAENLPDAEKEQFAPPVFETLAQQLNALSTAYERSDPAGSAKPAPIIEREESDNEFSPSAVNERELADLMD